MSLIGFTPRNHPQQKVRDQVDDRQTPLSVFVPLNEEHHFTLDAAASAANALCPKYFTRDTDGLLWPWSGERVWVNPPFSRLEAWVAKVWHEMRGGGGRRCCHARSRQSLRTSVVAAAHRTVPRSASEGRRDAHVSIHSRPHEIRRHQTRLHEFAAVRLRAPHVETRRLRLTLDQGSLEIA